IRPKWLFDNDTLTKSMNYQPVVAGNQPNDNACIKENFDADDDFADVSFDVKKNENDVHVSTSGSDKTDNKKQDEKAKRCDKGKSLFNTASSSDNVVSPNFRIARKSSFVDPSKYPDDPNMPELEDIVYSNDEEDVGAEADLSNLETIISVSPISTTTPQTRSMTRMVKEQGGLHQINDEDFHTCMFAYFLSQEEPKKVDQALKDPSWIEAMQEELFQFKMQKVWVLVDLPKAEILRKFGFTYVKSASTPIETKKPLLKDPDGEDVDVHIYSEELTIPRQTATDFLNAHTIQYALVVNPTIYVLCEAIDADEDITLVDMETQEEPNKDVKEPKKKRVAEETLLQESFKKLKAVEVSGSASTQEIPSNDPKEISEEDVQNMQEIVLVSEFKVEALQVKYPIIDWEIHTEGSRTYWKIIRVGGITEEYQIFKDMLKGFDKEDLVALWNLVKEKFSSAVPNVDKEKALWVELKRLFKPDADDVL
nr:putative ribonuclease H-like domain-containing protein [Tanacetum cinerariifolium]